MVRSHRKPLCGSSGPIIGYHSLGDDISFPYTRRLAKSTMIMWVSSFLYRTRSDFGLIYYSSTRQPANLRYVQFLDPCKQWTVESQLPSPYVLCAAFTSPSNLYLSNPPQLKYSKRNYLNRMEIKYKNIQLFASIIT